MAEMAPQPSPPLMQTSAPVERKVRSIDKFRLADDLLYFFSLYSPLGSGDQCEGETEKAKGVEIDDSYLGLLTWVLLLRLARTLALFLPAS